MAQEKPIHAAYEPDQISKEHTGIDSQPISGQVSLLQPLGDSQDPSNHAIAECPTFEEISTRTNTCSKKSQEVSYFTRPEVETAEEIAAGFQFQRAPPPQVITRGPCGPQGDKTSATSSMKEVSQSGSSSKPIDNSSQEGPPLTASCDEGPHEFTSINQSGKTADVVSSAPGAITSTFHQQDVNASDTSSSEDIYNYPFPDETNLPCPKKINHRSPRSSLAKAQFPKAITDTRRKALANISPHSRSSWAKASSPPVQGQAAQAKSVPSRNATSGDMERSAVSRPSHITNETAKDGQVDKVECNLRRHPTSERQRRQGLTRPIRREDSTKESVSMAMRPCSQASNISRPRAPRRTYHQGQTPTREQNSVNLMRFAKSWNTNYLYNQQLLDRWEDKMVMLEEQIAFQDSTIKQYEKDIEVRDQNIEELSNMVEELRTQSHKVQDEISASSNLRKKLEDKLRSCRVRLNEAISEQQRLFLQCKQSCQKATASIKADGQAQQESIERVSVTLDTVRAKIRQEVGMIAKDTTEQVGRLNDTIKSLEAQLEGRRKELECAEKCAESLREQLAESNKINEQSLRAVAAQNRELLEKMEQGRKQAENTESYIQKQDEKINAVLEALESARLRTVEPTILIENLKEVHNNSLATIIAELRSSTESTRNTVAEDQEILNGNLSEIRLLCEGICERMTATDDIALWQGRVHESDMAIHGQVQQIQGLQDELHQMHICTNEERQQRQDLERLLEGLQTAANNEQAADEEVNCLAEQVDNLQRVLEEKDIAISESGKSLEAAREELATQARILQSREEQLRNEHETHKKALELSNEQQKHAISRAVAEETRELREQQEALENRLQEAEAARARLEQELAESRQEAETSRQGKIGEDLHQIREEIVPIITLMTDLVADLEESGHEREGLRVDLENWSSNRIEINQMQQILWRLTKDQPNAIQMGNQLRELLEIQKKLSGTLEYHQARLANTRAAVVPDLQQLNSETTSKASNLFNSAVSATNDAVSTQEIQALNLKRKVVVKSPVTEDDGVSPVSIEQERSSRRHLTPLKSIMKVIAHIDPGELEDGDTIGVNIQEPATPPMTQPTPARRIAKRGPKAPLSTHSMYNRPVAGSTSGISKDQTNASRTGPNEHTSGVTINGIVYDFENTFTTDNVSEPPTKRQRDSEGGPHSGQGGHTTQKVKLSRSLSEYFPNSQPGSPEALEGMPPKPTTRSLRGGPLERAPSGLVTYGSQSARAVNPTDSQSTIASSQTMKPDSQS
ncbi:hypothetical protein GGS26DRAFT_592645 [Hypomontagnella submonticulosa]|nr:hypothetical protein GGS26DRAFT_592645 [Hypomontagnella submonticulosa]